MMTCVFEDDQYCKILTSKRCAMCKFYKTEKELSEGRRKALERVMALPNGKELLDKYYATSDVKQIKKEFGING